MDPATTAWLSIHGQTVLFFKEPLTIHQIFSITGGHYYGSKICIRNGF